MLSQDDFEDNGSFYVVDAASGTRKEERRREAQTQRAKGSALEFKRREAGSFFFSWEEGNDRMWPGLALSGQVRSLTSV